MLKDIPHAGSLHELIVPKAQSAANAPYTDTASACLNSSRLSIDVRRRLYGDIHQTANFVQSTGSKHGASTAHTKASRGLATLKAFSTALGSTVLYSLTGVFNQAARGSVTNAAHYPNPFLYSGILSGVAAAVAYFKHRPQLRTEGLAKSLKAIGPEGRTMCILMGINNALWVPAFMLTDLASAIVIACSEPFIYSIYARVRSGTKNSRMELASLGLSGVALATIAVNGAADSTAYPHAMWGNLAAASATLCFCAYMIINNHLIERAAARAGTSREAQEAAKQSVQGSLTTVPFFSQLTACLMGFGLFIPFNSGGFLGGGLGTAAGLTLAMATLQGVCAAAALRLHTLATQTNKPLVVSLVTNLQVGITPALGYLILGNTIPNPAIIAGLFMFAASVTTVAEDYIKRRPEEASSV